MSDGSYLFVTALVPPESVAGFEEALRGLPDGDGTAWAPERVDLQSLPDLVLVATTCALAHMRALEAKGVVPRGTARAAYEEPGKLGCMAGHPGNG